MASINKPEKAVRLARAIASDISLYNEEKIAQAIESDTFLMRSLLNWKKGARFTIAE